MFKVICTSICGTYRESLLCKTIEEARAYADAMEMTGEWTTKIVGPKK